MPGVDLTQYLKVNLRLNIIQIRWKGVIKHIPLPAGHYDVKQQQKKLSLCQRLGSLIPSIINFTCQEDGSQNFLQREQTFIHLSIICQNAFDPVPL